MGREKLPRFQTLQRSYEKAVQLLPPCIEKENGDQRHALRRPSSPHLFSASDQRVYGPVHRDAVFSGALPQRGLIRKLE